MKKRNKKYAPKIASANTLEWAIAGRCLLPKHMQDGILGSVRQAMQDMRFGRLTKDTWNTLANAANIAEALCYLNIGNNLLPQIEYTQNALHDIAMRMIERGTSTCYAQELATITEGMEMYEIQLSLCTQAELTKALKNVERAHNDGRMVKVKDAYERMAA